MKTSNYTSWGNRGAVPHLAILPANMTQASVVYEHESNIVHGMGRSYGDVCLNANGGLIDSRYLDRLIEYDEGASLITCQSGVVLKHLIAFLELKNKFVTVSPGTSNVTLGGMVANDVHGKNHHRVGSFGNHVQSLTLLKGDGSIEECSENINNELFLATIGGLGLTGMILTVTLKLKSVENNCIAIKSIKTKNIEQMLALFDETDDEYEYTVAWLDMHSSPQKGIFSCGNHAVGDIDCTSSAKAKTIPVNAPNWLLNGLSSKLFNKLYYFKGKQYEHDVSSYQSFFYPLDGVDYWNRLYGRRGFYQYQFVVPYGQFLTVYTEILKHTKQFNQPCYLAVLKKFGEIKSIGLLSFPRAGYTLAMDFPDKGDDTLKMFEAFDNLVMDAGGAVYPAKDARMSRDVFLKSFPGINEFMKYKDEKFCSDFWRRVNLDG